MTTNAESLMRNKDISLALALPVFGTWDKDEDGSYREAEQPARIGRILVDQVHRHLVNARIGYLFRESMSDRDRVRLAQASKVGAKLQYYAELDFLIEVNWEAWLKLEEEARVALIDHELCHFGVDSGTDKYVLLGHDLEEFGAIVRRWGMWRPDVLEFGRALADQGDLFRQVERDNTKVTFRAGGSDPVEMTSRDLEKAAESVSGKRRK